MVNQYIVEVKWAKPNMKPSGYHYNTKGIFNN